MPVVLVTSHSEPEDVADGLRRGAHDYLRKPFEQPELVARVHAAMRTKALRDELRARNAQLERLVSTDLLTGLLNRGATADHLRALVSRSQRHGLALSVVLLDVDGIGDVNAGHGHAAGDTRPRDGRRARAQPAARGGRRGALERRRAARRRARHGRGAKRRRARRAPARRRRRRAGRPRRRADWPSACRPAPRRGPTATTPRRSCAGPSATPRDAPSGAVVRRRRDGGGPPAAATSPDRGRAVPPHNTPAERWRRCHAPVIFQLRPGGVMGGTAGPDLSEQGKAGRGR